MHKRARAKSGRNERTMAQLYEVIIPLLTAFPWRRRHRGLARPTMVGSDPGAGGPSGSCDFPRRTTRAGRTAGVKDFTDPAYQKEITDAKAADQIKNGMKDKDGKEKMKAYADKLNDDEVKALLAFIRTLAPTK